MADIAKQDTQDQVISIIIEKLNIDKNMINGQSTLQDLGADSLDMVEIIMKLEEKFNIEINDEEAERLKNVNDVIEYVHSKRISK